MTKDNETPEDKQPSETAQVPNYPKAFPLDVIANGRRTSERPFRNEKTSKKAPSHDTEVSHLYTREQMDAKIHALKKGYEDFKKGISSVFKQNDDLYADYKQGWQYAKQEQEKLQKFIEQNTLGKRYTISNCQFDPKEKNVDFPQHIQVSDGEKTVWYSLSEDN
ncbi:MAG: hypothetical protein HQM11_16420 [SAR324 cluster bacterium]|nr:hypothetical protein [SAR324 cluster bacterium]